MYVTSNRSAMHARNFSVHPIYVTCPSCLVHFKHMQTSSDAPCLCKYFQPADATRRGLRFSLENAHRLTIRSTLRDSRVLGNFLSHMATQFFQPTSALEFLFFVYPPHLVVFQVDSCLSNPYSLSVLKIS